MNDLIKKLVEAYGPSGFEDQVRELIHEEVKELADEISVDAMGNLTATKNSATPGKTVMVAAHMDEIGVMVTHVTEKGFVRFTNIGGLNPHTFLGNRVQFADGTVGVIHADRSTDAGRIQPMNKYFIDVGATSREDCPVGPGDAGGFLRPLHINNRHLSAKSMDDRIGCVVAIEALRRLKSTPHTVHFVFTVQEEVGTRGAQIAANRYEPDVGIALDVTLTGDVPEALPMAVSLGEGAAIKVKDAGMIAHAGLVKLMKQRAQENKIPYQLEVLTGGTTDARPIQISNAGVAAGCISIPCRYVHSQSETVHADDVEACVNLLVAILENPIEL